MFLRKLPAILSALLVVTAISLAAGCGSGGEPATTPSTTPRGGLPKLLFFTSEG